MKNRKIFFFLRTFFIVLLFYLSDVTLVMAGAPQGPEPAAELETEPAARPAAGLETEPDTEPEAESEPEQASGTEPAAGPESVSSGAELLQWMEAHKYTGGSVQLTGNIVLEESCMFVLAGSVPAERILVDTAGYTITVTGTAEFWSNSYLTFRGQAGGQGIFHVEKGGMLSLNGISVENRQEEGSSETVLPYALWQEEGAGLIVSDCQVTGKVHYADTPFVMYKNSTYVIVEKGQTARDVLPAEMKCSVNYQGQVSNNQSVQVSWDLAGTEERQEKRLRFQVQGTFAHAVSELPPVCAVAYNDYPLTFTEAEACVSGGSYIFQGEYTRPAEFLSMKLISAYSFDGADWIVCDEKTVTDEIGTFFIGLPSEQWDTVEHPYLYIRLQGEYNGIQYFSNVLRYTADDLEVAEDQGGDRGGGTSIANLPDGPQKGITDEPLDNGGASGAAPGADVGADAGTNTESDKDNGAGTDMEPEGSKASVVSKDGEPESGKTVVVDKDTEPEDSTDSVVDKDTEPEDSIGSGTGMEMESEDSLYCVWSGYNRCPGRVHRVSGGYGPYPVDPFGSGSQERVQTE